MDAPSMSHSKLDELAPIAATINNSASERQVTSDNTEGIPLLGRRAGVMDVPVLLGNCTLCDACSNVPWGKEGWRQFHTAGKKASNDQWNTERCIEYEAELLRLRTTTPTTCYWCNCLRSSLKEMNVIYSEVIEDGRISSDGKIRVALDFEGFNCSRRKITLHRMRVFLMDWYRPARIFGLHAEYGSAAARYFFSPMQFYCAAPDSSVDKLVLTPNGVDLDLAKSWIGVCQETHDACPTSPNPNRTLPTRLLTTARNGSSARPVHLHLSSKSQNATYACLSYAWGSGTQSKSSLAHLALREQGIPYDELPPAFQDALSVINALGIDYLWIDAVCIDQDDRDDQVRELAKMHQYYSNADLLILPSGIRSANDRFLGHSRIPTCPSPFQLANVPYYDETGQRRRNGLKMIWTEDWHGHGWSCYAGENEPAYGRAWVLQEQLLCRRVLEFPSAGGMMFQCDTLGKDVQVDGNLPLRHIRFEVLRLPRKPLRQTESEGPGSVSVSDVVDAWENCVEDYSSRTLTNRDDTLIAIAALATEFSSRYGNVLGPYYAGLWGNFVVPGLCWKVPLSNTERPKDRGVPSWSWASVTGVQFTPGAGGFDEEIVSEVEVLHCHTDIVQPTLPKGHVRSGRLTLRGKTTNAVWKPNPTPYDGYDTSRVTFGGRLQMESEDSHQMSVDSVHCLPRDVEDVVILLLCSPKKWDDDVSWTWKAPVGLVLKPISTGEYTRYGSIQFQSPNDFEGSTEARWLRFVETFTTEVITIV